MTIEEKTLLVKDLSARLPYGVRIREYNDEYRWHDGVLSTITNDYFSKGEPSIEGDWINRVEDVKPYLRPMSSMTEEELNECVCQSGIKDIECPNWKDIPNEKQFEARLNHAIAVFLTDSNNVDWLNAHHFDYRGLIEKGLAIKAPKEMYK